MIENETWWKESDLNLKHYGDLVDRASMHGQPSGHVEVLRWWKDSEAELAYSEDALRYAIDRRELRVLRW
ncbi:hypothetical protein DFJ73DRAFT_777989 [Zopfochytrium polystomum]|nr:hypothetical protein DFJ73DRAFT_777989 [Zopfochytrium polystomum]